MMMMMMAMAMAMVIVMMMIHVHDIEAMVRIHIISFHGAAVIAISGDRSSSCVVIIRMMINVREARQLIFDRGESGGGGVRDDGACRAG